MASLPNSPAKKAKGKTPLRGGIVAKNKTLSAAGPEEGEAKSSRAAKESARLIEPPSSGASVARICLPMCHWCTASSRWCRGYVSCIMYTIPASVAKFCSRPDIWVNRTVWRIHIWRYQIRCFLLKELDCFTSTEYRQNAPFPSQLFKSK